MSIKTQLKIQNWYWILFYFTLVAGSIITFYAYKTQEAEMRHNLLTYVKTIEQSINWQPFSNTLNAYPGTINKADLSNLRAQLNAACRANKDCHFIYLLYEDQSKIENQITFFLDASPQPLSEISQMGDVYLEATDSLKQAIHEKTPLVEGPNTDHWGTWVTGSVPVSITTKTPNFLMLSVDMAAKGWSKRRLNEVIYPLVITLLFSGVFLCFIIQNKSREKVLHNMTNASAVLFDQANNDALTGLPNRRLLEDRMLQAFNAADRAKHNVGVLFLDLDRFKSVNDKQGHLIGDLLLKEVSARLSMLRRNEDTVSRIGGDEFVVLLPILQDENDAINVAQKIVTEISKPFYIEGLTIQLGVSIGVSIYPKQQDTPHQLLKYADIAMYEAKRKGRNCFVIYKEDTFL